MGCRPPLWRVFFVIHFILVQQLEDQIFIQRQWNTICHFIHFDCFSPFLCLCHRKGEARCAWNHCSRLQVGPKPCQGSGRSDSEQPRTHHMAVGDWLKYYCWDLASTHFRQWQNHHPIPPRKVRMRPVHRAILTLPVKHPVSKT
jgi:hypothetical protein